MFGQNRSGHGLPQAMRMVELLDTVKNEYETLAIEMGRLKQLNDDYERKLEQQVAELEAIQRTLFDLQNNQASIKHKYEEEILRLRRQVETSENKNAFGKRPRVDEGLLPSRDPPAVDSVLPSASSAFSRTVEASNTPAARKLFGEVNIGDALRSLSASAASHANQPATSLPSATSSVPSVLGSTASSSAMRSTLPSAFSSSAAREGGQAPALAPLNGQRDTGTSVLPALNSIKQESDVTMKQEPMETGSQANGEDGKDDTAASAAVEGTEKTTTTSTDETKDGTKKSWSVDPATPDLQLLRTLKHKSVVCSVRFSPDSQYIATGSNKITEIYSSESGELVTSFATGDSKSDKADKGAQDAYVRSVCFNADSTCVCAGVEDKSIKVWNIESKKVVKTLSGHASEIYSLDYSSNGRFIVSGSGDKTAKLWNVEEQSLLHDLGTVPAQQHQDGVTSVCFSPDGELVVTGCLDRIIRLWNVNTGAFVNEFKGHSEPVYSVSFSPDGKSIASGSLDKTIKIWDVNSNSCRGTLSSHSDYVLSVAFGLNDEWLVSGSKDRTVAFWDPRAMAKPLYSLYGHRNSVITVSMSSQGGLFATGSGDCRARVWSFSQLIPSSSTSAAASTSPRIHSTSNSTSPLTLTAVPTPSASTTTPASTPASTTPTPSSAAMEQ